MSISVKLLLLDELVGDSLWAGVQVDGRVVLLLLMVCLYAGLLHGCRLYMWYFKLWLW